MDYKSNSSCSSPSKDMKNPDRCGLPYGTPVPVLPVRNNLRRPNSSHFPPASRFHFRKGLASKCSWKCTAIVFIMLSVVLTAALSFISGNFFLHAASPFAYLNVYSSVEPFKLVISKYESVLRISRRKFRSRSLIKRHHIRNELIHIQQTEGFVRR